MPFPEWGYSYNALYVPLSGGWHCALMPVSELPAVDRGWQLSYDERKQKKKEREEQIEQDKQDFDRLFRLRIDARGARFCSEFREYVAFINRHLRVSNWDLQDGAGITRALRSAVRDGNIIPVIARNWHGGRRVFRRYAPQQWTSGGGGSLALGSGGSNAPTGRFTGPFAAAMHVADTVMNSRLATSSRAVSSAGGGGRGGGGFAWLSAVEAVGGAVAGSVFGDSDDDSSGESMLKSFGDSGGDGGSMLGDAEPFKYSPDELSDDSFDIAASTNNPSYAAKMLGYDRDTFGDMIHAMKYNLDLRGDDNVIWHDNGDVEFKKNIIGNMHDYTN
ncbi:hypothetical protein [Caballeronia insecticola]|uniref:Uncharacterized protein n=1 Tax=Caballeronia insecticola TaxID=758793 RepID=R4WFL2_9BURK|nr:hypothetical protein [Caballeronia insecticola]BAN22473.1 putative uncharacterized protein [Caballeronia insecticola]